MSGDSSSLPGEEDLESINFVTKVCMGLVTVERESGIIRLLHHTALEYLQQNMTCLWSLENTESGIPPPKSSKCAMREIHQDMAKTCIQYLSLEAISHSLGRIWWNEYKATERHPLLNYAMRHWDHHWRQGFNEMSLPVRMIEKTTAFLGSNMMTIIPKAVNPCLSISENSLNEMTPMHFAAFFGLTGMIDVCLNNGHDLHAATGEGENALWFALMGKHEETSKMLLTRGSREAFVELWVQCRFSSLGLAINHRMRTAADLLLDDGFCASVNAETEFCPHWGQAADCSQCYHCLPPLLAAAKNGDLEMTKMLLERGADPLVIYDASSTFGAYKMKEATALTLAARGGHRDVVELLLRADDSAVNAADGYCRTPLYWAICSGNWATMRRHGGRLFGDGTGSDPGLPTNGSLINGQPDSMRFWGRDGMFVDVGK